MLLVPFLETLFFYKGFDASGLKTSNGVHT